MFEKDAIYIVNFCVDRKFTYVIASYREIIDETIICFLYERISQKQKLIITIEISAAQ